MIFLYLFLTASIIFNSCCASYNLSLTNPTDETRYDLFKQNCKTVIAESDIINLKQLETDIDAYSKIIPEYSATIRESFDSTKAVEVVVINIRDLNIERIKSNIRKVQSSFSTFDKLCETNKQFFETIHSENDCNFSLEAPNYCDERLKFFEQIKNESRCLLDTIQWIQNYPHQKDQQAHVNDLNRNSDPNKEVTVIKIQPDELQEKEKKKVLFPPLSPDEVEKVEVKITTPSKWHINRRILLTGIGLVMFSIIAICAYFKKFPTLRTMP